MAEKARDQKKQNSTGDEAKKDAVSKAKVEGGPMHEMIETLAVLDNGKERKCCVGMRTGYLRIQQIRSRMIENGRNEDACRQMDALADEDDTIIKVLVASFEQDRFRYYASAAQI